MIGKMMKALGAGRNAIDQALRHVDEIREQIADQKAEVARVQAAPVPVEEAMAEFDQWAASAASGALDGLGIGSLLDPAMGARGLGVTLPAVRYGNEMQFDSRPAVQALMGLIVATGLPTLRGLVQEHLTAETDGLEQMSAATRQKKLAAAHRALLELELAEEAAIRSLEGAGVPVARRADASPAAVLAASAALPG